MSAKAQANDMGVTWAVSKSKRLDIALGADTPGTYGQPDMIEVWALYFGTHDVAPLTRRFTGADRLREAREYANSLWRTH